MTASPFHNGLGPAIESWKEALGDDNVSDDQATRRDAEQCTFPTDQQIPAIIYPGSTEEVQKCVQIANEFLVPIYPISRGRNWGLGSKVPVHSGCVLMDLRRMDRIIEFNDELGYITVQPGVTFQSVYNHQQANDATHFLATGGGPPDASVLGNFIERGTGLGEFGERPRHICNMTVVSGRADVVRTGFSQREPSAELSSVTNWGIGPSIDGLFFQSNFGIVTEATVWLTPCPEDFFSFVGVIKSETQMQNSVKVLRNLIKQKVVGPYSVALWSAAKFAAAMGQHPNPSSGVIDIEEFVGEKGKPFRGMKWLLFGGVGSGSAALGKAKKALIKQDLNDACSRFLVVDRRRAWLLDTVNVLLNSFGRSKQDTRSTIVETLYRKSVFLGHPTTGALKTLYWRKATPPPDDIDPHRDDCGIRWLCHELPNLLMMLHGRCK